MCSPCTHQRCCNVHLRAHTHMDGCCAAPMSLMNVDAKQATTALPTLGIAHTTVLVSSCTRKSAVQLTKQAMAVVLEGKCKCACVPHYASYFACKCKCQVNKPSTINTHATYQTNVAPRRREEKALYISQLRQHARQHAGSHVSMHVSTQPERQQRPTCKVPYLDFGDVFLDRFLTIFLFL